MYAGRRTRPRGPDTAAPPRHSPANPQAHNHTCHQWMATPHNLNPPGTVCMQKVNYATVPYLWRLNSSNFACVTCVGLGSDAPP